MAPSGPFSFFFFNDTATTEIYTLSLHDALPICYEDMKLYARDRGFIFPFLYDGGTQATALAYGCLCTPHLFIFNKQRLLCYKGRFDDSQVADPASVHSTDGANA